MPQELPPTWVIALCASTAVLLVLLGAWLARAFARGAQRSRNRTAQAGEALAERILAREGFTVVSRQATARYHIAVDGELVSVSVRADLIVERDGARYVAEVKTGELAPDPRHPPTRRQLMEYAVVFGAEEVLLVDVPSRRVHVVTFPRIAAHRVRTCEGRGSNAQAS